MNAHNWAPYTDQLEYCTLCGVMNKNAPAECKGAEIYERYLIAKNIKSKTKGARL